MLQASKRPDPLCASSLATATARSTDPLGVFDLDIAVAEGQQRSAGDAVFREIRSMTIFLLNLR